jgi:hypothetical protein
MVRGGDGGGGWSSGWREKEEHASEKMQVRRCKRTRKTGVFKEWRFLEACQVTVTQYGVLRKFSRIELHETLDRDNRVANRQQNSKAPSSFRYLLLNRLYCLPSNKSRCQLVTFVRLALFTL